MRHRHLIENNPVLLKEDWLPGEGETPWPELEELRETHQRLLGERSRTSQAIFELRRQFEHEDEQRHRTLADSYLKDEKVKLPPVTPDEKRETGLREAFAQAEAAADAFGEFCAQALDLLTEKQERWNRDLDKHRQEALAEKQEALKLVAEADAKAREYDRLRGWLVYAASGNSGRGINWGALETPPAEQPIELRPGLAGTELGYAEVGHAS